VRSEMTMASRSPKYGPRGSAESVSNIARRFERNENTKACCWKTTACWRSRQPGRGGPRQSDRRRSAQMAIFAEVLGGAKNIPPELLKATVASKRRIRPRQASKGAINLYAPIFDETLGRGDRPAPIHQ